ncbi:peptidylprolyl isomerase [Cloacibacterium rupense]|uniref:peptidylprolyl isomerase n=1 Tax=Cloacibacterium rupense TaxID=517423 RepID=A0ABQ2NJG2_9FLAO|nr:peptidylprolyl isomerase [Cloacibacterium rupense]GGP04919.1 peptidylprolyl isomerase [Cloacibacterium rupense]
MIKNLKYLLTLSFLVSLFSFNANAQVKKGDLVDGISAVVGNEIILESEVLEQQNYAQQQGAAQTNKCEFMDGILSNKLLIYKAKKDTLIQDRSAAIREQAADKYSQIVSQFPSEKAMLDAYKFRTSYEMKNAIEKMDIDNYYGQQKYALVTEKVNITPNEVTDFYNAYKYQLPQVKDEIVLSKIAMYPKLTEAHKDEIINKLKKIKQDILAGDSFDNKARIYSEDPGSAANGGLYTNINRGKMVKIFEATALNLQEGEISEPVESEFGFHIIQLVKKSGKQYDARHILLKAEPNAEEIATAKAEMEKIKEDIKSGKLTFKEAAFKYSDDKNTKFNAGVMPGEDGSDRLEKANLNATVAYQIAGLNKGDLTDVFVFEEPNQKKAVTIMKVNEVIPMHALDLATDFERIKGFALNKKKGEVLEKWVKEQLPDTFISINNRYKDCNFKEDWSKSAIIK